MEIKRENFSKKQWEIIVSKENYKQIIASAGSGKTRTVVGYTLFNLEYEKIKDKILLLSFSRKACGELRHRIPKEYLKFVEIRTFHSFCYHYIKKYHPVYKNKNFSILEDEQKYQVIKNILLENPEITYGIPYKILIKSFNKIQYYLPELYNYVKYRLENYKKENNFLEYEDLIDMVVKGLSEKKTWTLPLLGEYKNIIVDEFQDTDPKQVYFLNLIQPKKLFVVGDDWQAIYGFRGATVIPLLKFRKIFKNSTIYKLDENYRSLKPIVDKGNYVISKSYQKIKKSVKAIRGKGVNIPVLILSNEEKNFYDSLIQLINQYKIMILVRSNFRKDFWIQKGVLEENVMTIHKSKGLEFPVVLLDIEAGWSGESFLTDEEIRICYVGITRAQNICIILYNDKKKFTIEYFLFYQFFARNTNKINLSKLEKYLDIEKKFRNKY